ncbi:glycosyltransferase [Aliarcobacter butzleri]
MKLIYVANSTIPSTSANSVHAMKMCEGFKKNGVDVELVLPNNNSLNNEFGYYGITNVFTINRLKSISPNPIGYKNYLFSLLVIFKYILFKKDIMIMSKNFFVCFLGIILSKKVIFEVHGRLNGITLKLFKIFNVFNSKYIIKYIVISNPLRKIYIDEFEVKEEKILVLPDGVTSENFEHFNSTEPFNSSSFNIGYIGSLYKGRGIDIIIEMAKVLLDHKFNIYGGEEDQLLALKEEIKQLNLNNIFVYGHIANSEVPKILCEQDILLMPYQKKVQVRGSEDTSAWMSPMKMFEYMASRRVIISSDMPVLREILNENNSFLVPSDNVEAWIQTIKNIENNIELARKIALCAKEDVQNYTWTKRAKRIIEAINER